jgi:hypothetical protein
LTPQKRHSLVHCCSSLNFIRRYWRSRDKHVQAIQVGLGQGLDSILCNWALMLVMFGSGLESLGWVFVIAIIALSESRSSYGARVASAAGAALISLGLLTGLPASLSPLSSSALFHQTPLLATTSSLVHLTNYIASSGLDFAFAGAIALLVFLWSWRSTLRLRWRQRIALWEMYDPLQVEVFHRRGNDIDQRPEPQWSLKRLTWQAAGTFHSRNILIDCTSCLSTWNASSSVSPAYYEELNPCVKVPASGAHDEARSLAQLKRSTVATANR